MTRQTPHSIGVFDSGLGGLSVLLALRKQLPFVALHYLADSACAPYGERGSDFLIERSLLIAQHLRSQGAQMLVVACNTATTHAIAALRERWPDMPIVGVEPGIKPAASATRNGRIGVLTTSATARSARFAQLASAHGAGIQVLTQACPGLADLIETGSLDSPALREMVGRFVQPLLDAEVDTVVLGCTHYPLIRPLFRRALGGQVLIVDTEAAIARQTARRWHQTPAAQEAAPTANLLTLSTTGSSALLSQFTQRCLGWQGLPVSSAAL